MISPTCQLQIIYRKPRSDELYQRVLDLPGPIETSGVNFQSDDAFRARVTRAFRAAIVSDHAASNEAWSDQNPDAWSLHTYGDEADGYQIIAVFGLGARPRALVEG